MWGNAPLTFVPVRSHTITDLFSDAISRNFLVFERFLLSFRFDYTCQAMHWIITPSQLNFILLTTAGLSEKILP